MAGQRVNERLVGRLAPQQPDGPVEPAASSLTIRTIAGLAFSCHWMLAAYARAAAGVGNTSISSTAFPLVPVASLMIPGASWPAGISWASVK